MKNPAVGGKYTAMFIIRSDSTPQALSTTLT
jgi:hypothetical protein